MMNSTNTCATIAASLAEMGSWTAFDSVKIVFSMIYSVIFALGLIGNTLVLIAVCRFRALQTVRNIFILNLSVSDLIVCLSCLPITAYATMYLSWPFGLVLCKVIPTIQGASIFLSTFTLACIAVDRYILLVHITWSSISKGSAGIIIITIWGLALVLCVPIGYFSVITVDGSICDGIFCEEDWPSPRSRSFYGYGILTCQYVLPLCLIAFCYASIVMAINNSALVQRYKSRTKSHGGSSARPGSACSNVSVITPTQTKPSAAERRFKSNQMQIAMVCMFAVSQLPHNVYNIMRDVGKLPRALEDQRFFCALVVQLFASTSTIWNPFLYAFMNTNFRSAFLTMFACCSGAKMQRGPAPSNMGSELDRGATELLVPRITKRPSVSVVIATRDTADVHH